MRKPLRFRIYDFIESIPAFLEFILCKLWHKWKEQGGAYSVKDGYMCKRCGIWFK